MRDPIEAEIEKLQREYLDTLVEKRELIATALHRAASDGDWSGLKHHCHKIAGSAGTYQYWALSEITRYMEDLIVSGSLATMPNSKQFCLGWLEAIDSAISAYHRLKGRKIWTQALVKVDTALKSQWIARKSALDSMSQEAA